MTEYVLLVVGAVLVNNFVLTRFLGICPFLGVSRKGSTAPGMSGSVLFVLTAALLCALGLRQLWPRLGMDRE